MFTYKGRKPNVGKEALAALTSFLTVSYILVVNPGILSEVGIDYNTAFVATALSAGIASILFGLIANRPFVLAAGMGLNAYFAYAVVGGMGVPVGAALAAVFLAGLLILALSRSGLKIGEAIPESFKHALIGGLGLFLVFVGLQNSHIVVSDPATLLAMGDLSSAGAIVAIMGFFATSLLVARGVTGGLFLGIVITTIVAMVAGLTPLPSGIVSMPPQMAPVWENINFYALLDTALLPVIWAFFAISLFDEVGTMAALSAKSGHTGKRGKVKGLGKSLGAASLGMMGGAALGVPPVIPFLESATGIKAGGRTGMVAVIAGLFFIASLFFFPLVKSVPVEAAAPAVIIAGLLMLSGIGKIDYGDYTESVPALMALAAIPFTFSIANGIGIGSISYVFLKVATNRWKEIHPAMLIVALLSIIVFAGAAA
jgi:AGZA family xanthine/uracil permease-like MFS transporter